MDEEEAKADERRIREKIRSGRRREVRSTTISMFHLTKREQEAQRLLYPQAEIDENQAERPRTRADCQGGLRPCPWVGCRHNLFLDVVGRPHEERPSSIKLNFPDLEPGEMAHSCVLDIAEKGPLTLEQFADAMNLTRERGRQIEEKILVKIRSIQPAGLFDHVEEGAPMAMEGLTQREKVLRALAKARRATPLMVMNDTGIGRDIVLSLLAEMILEGKVRTRGSGSATVYYLEDPFRTTAPQESKVVVSSHSTLEPDREPLKEDFKEVASAAQSRSDPDGATCDRITELEAENVKLRETLSSVCHLAKEAFETIAIKSRSLPLKPSRCRSMFKGLRCALEDGHGGEHHQATAIEYTTADFEPD